MMRRLPDGARWTDFATPAGQLQFSGFRLAHAVVKADFLNARNYALPSLGFLLQIGQIIDLRSGSGITLFPGASSILGDVSQTSLAARLGQGLSLLFAEWKGYRFSGHLASDSSVRSQLGTNRPVRVADFLFEDRGGCRMILESKATFSLPHNQCSRVKTVLKKALEEQVDPWMARVAPPATKGFAVLSCLRESGNPTPSAIVFVDPPEQSGSSPIQLPADWVKRRNYGAWLKAMGLSDAAERLIGGASSAIDLETINLRIATVGDRRFAITRLLGRPGSRYDLRFVLGIEVDALEAISAANRGSSEVLEKYQPSSREDFSEYSWPSILSDGTLFGPLESSKLTGQATFIL